MCCEPFSRTMCSIISSFIRRLLVEEFMNILILAHLGSCSSCVRLFAFSFVVFMKKA